MTFSKNYLSNQSQPWAREVAKRIINIERAFRSAEVNNTTRDDQLASSFRRLDANVLATQAATEDALDAINKVLGLGQPDGDPIDGSNVINNSLPGAKITANTITANEIAANAITASQIASDTITANEIATGTITADEIASNTITASEIASNSITASEIAANAITANEIATGAITANEIAANTITASEIASNTITASEIAANAITANEIAAGTITASEIDADYIYAGDISANQINAGTLSADYISGGTIDASDITVTNLDASEITSGSLSADRISGGTISGVTVTSSSGTNAVTLNNGVISISGSGGSGQIRGAGGYNFELFAGSFGDIIVSANSIEGVWANFAQFGSSGSRFNGENFPNVASNNQSTFAANVFLNSDGEMFRDPTISSREAKENIETYNFNTESFIKVNPVVFEYKEEAFPQLTGQRHLGFILEDFEEAGLGEHLVIPANEVDKYKGLRYDKLYMFLHKTVQELNERVKAIENG